MTRQAAASTGKFSRPVGDRHAQLQFTAETKKTLLDIARQHFGMYGYSGIALEGVTAAAGLTRGALYYYFGSKTGLFCSVVDEIDEEIERAFNVKLRETQGVEDDWWLMIRSACHCYLNALDHPDARQILVRDGPNHYPNFPERRIRLRCHANTVKALEALHARGEVAMNNAEAAAQLLEGAMGGLVGWAVAAEVGLTETKAQFDLFLSSMRTR
jgi:AcrR family transcriptional regulator